LKRCGDNDISVSIISHKTKNAVIGGYDLHQSAIEWLIKYNLVDSSHTGLTLDNVFLNETRELKNKMIGKIGCSLFIDDLAEVFTDPFFPDSVTKILFSPDNKEPDGECADYIASSWNQISELVFNKVRINKCANSN